MESTCQSMAEHIKRQAEKAEPLIKKGFEKLRSFLEEEEKKLLNNLKKEEEKKTKLVEEKKDSMGKKIKSLSSKIKTIKKEMEEMEPITFLREFEDVLKRALGDTEEEAEDLSGCLIDMPKHVGNLTFEIWRSMRNICPYSPVLLNPNTSCSLTVLSDDLTTVENTYGRLNLPSNPERISCVLGSEPVIDYHYVWEVQVNAHKYWDIGVIKAKKVEGANLWSRVTCLRSRSEQFSSTARHSIEVAGTSTPLTLDEPPETVRVELDQEEGTLSFYDGKSKLLHALEHDFTEDVLPFFDSYHQKEPVKFLPIDPWISLDPCAYMLMV
ncbi:E3 ubiquitin-protein ligase TRIM35-like [Engraulis encrasicolus]|uniref:E3 ubiquitin-protein ligase TRIM35-like n=1 Tax=Engraulis encrasicolus TaxID=184585 RepID=UPI002FCF44F0